MRPSIKCITGQDRDRQEKLQLNWGVHKLKWLHGAIPFTKYEFSADLILQ